mmetsp:Transcript_4810/g.7279  ORF Transcript_4810/g.7279 Transcript_4810/m.7279 type:complete len:240 (+) Transcript_4810:109-828(+)
MRPKVGLGAALPPNQTNVSLRRAHFAGNLCNSDNIFQRIDRVRFLALVPISLGKKRFIRVLILHLHVHKDISRRTNDSRRAHRNHFLVIELIPIVRAPTASERCVMPVPYRSVVIGHGHQIIIRMVPLRAAVIDHPIQDHPIRWENNKIADFVPPLPPRFRQYFGRRFESFQVDDEDRRKLPQVQFLGGVGFNFAFRAVPAVLAVQLFNLAEALQAVVQRQVGAVLWQAPDDFFRDGQA